MQIFKATLVLLNEDEWLQHAMKIIESRGSKCDDELLEEICTFDFKFGITSQKYPTSSS